MHAHTHGLRRYGPEERRGTNGNSTITCWAAVELLYLCISSVCLADERTTGKSTVVSCSAEVLPGGSFHRWWVAVWGSSLSHRSSLPRQWQWWWSWFGSVCWHRLLLNWSFWMHLHWIGAAWVTAAELFVGAGELSIGRFWALFGGGGGCCRHLHIHKDHLCQWVCSWESKTSWKVPRGKLHTGLLGNKKSKDETRYSLSDAGITNYLWRKDVMRRMEKSGSL